MSTSVGEPTSAQSEVMRYLDIHGINDQLTLVINKLAKQRVADPFAFLSDEFKQLSKQGNQVGSLVGREILDSRGNPTVEADVYVSGKLVARQGAPSGASTGSNEAHELRDGDTGRYLGKGTSKAANNVTTALNDAVKGLDVTDLRKLDDALKAADGTELKTKLGGNAITAASFALAEAGANITHTELFQHLAKTFYTAINAQQPNQFYLPRPMVNILNGGKHAGGDLMIQEFMIVPRVGSFKENLRMVAEVYHHLAKILVAEKGPSAKNLGDEGGYAPALSSPDETLTYIERAISAAGYVVGQDVFLALDAAASEFYKDGKYEVVKGTQRTSEELLAFWDDLIEKHPALISIEDGFDEKDYAGWTAFTAHMAQKRPNFMIVGDDLYTTNTNLISKGIEGKWANALLLKVNQIGTISESMDAAQMIFNAKGNVIVSHRSGETHSSLIADLAVAIGAQFIKTGATARGERISKYNRLLAIEEYLQSKGMLTQVSA